MEIFSLISEVNQNYIHGLSFLSCYLAVILYIENLLDDINSKQISRFFHMCYYISGGKRRPPLTQPVRYQSPDLGSSTEPSLTTRRRTSGTLTLRLGQRSRSLRKLRVVGIWLRRSCRSWRSLNLMCVVELYTIRGNGVLNTVHGTCHRVLAT